MRDPLYVLFLFWSRGKHKAKFLRAVHMAKFVYFFYQFQCWEGMKQAELAGKKLALSSVNRGVALGSTCMFGAMF